jgi:hypothetical protein
VKTSSPIGVETAPCDTLERLPGDDGIAKVRPMN